MSKQSEAKESQGYTTEQRNCGSCAHRTFDMELPLWMRTQQERDGYLYGDQCRVEKNQRCAIGAFAVKKTATCNRFELPADGVDIDRVHTNR